MTDNTPPKKDTENPTTPQVAFLASELERYIDGYRRRAYRSRGHAFRLRMVTVILGVLTTLILGLKSSAAFDRNFEPILSAIALCLSAIIPIFAAWDSFFDYRWLWIQNAAASAKLRAILFDLSYAASSGEPVARKELDELYARFHATFDETNTAWQDKNTKAVEVGRDR